VNQVRAADYSLFVSNEFIEFINSIGRNAVRAAGASISDIVMNWESKEWDGSAPY
jgi:hypothetical protein